MTAEEALAAIAERLGRPGSPPAMVFDAVRVVLDQRNQLYDAVIGTTQPDDQPITLDVTNSLGTTIDVSAHLTAGRVSSTGKWIGPFRITVIVQRQEQVVQRILHLRREYKMYFDEVPHFGDAHGVDSDIMLLSLGYLQGRLVERGYYTQAQINEHLRTGEVPAPVVNIEPIGELPR